MKRGVSIYEKLLMNSPKRISKKAYYQKYDFIKSNKGNVNMIDGRLKCGEILILVIKHRNCSERQFRFR